MKVIGVGDPDRKKQFKINTTPSAMAGFLIDCAGLTAEPVEAYKPVDLG